MTGNEYIQFVLARYPNADLDKVDSFFKLYDLKEVLGDEFFKWLGF